MLDGKRKDDGTVTCCGVGLRTCFMAGEENFPQAPIFKTRDGRAVMETVHLEVERHACASAWQALAHGNGLRGSHATPFPFFRAGEAAPRLSRRIRRKRGMPVSPSSTVSLAAAL